MEYSSAIRRNILLKTIQTVTYYTIQILQHFQNDKIRDVKENGVCQGLGMVGWQGIESGKVCGDEITLYLVLR